MIIIFDFKNLNFSFVKTNNKLDQLCCFFLLVYLFVCLCQMVNFVKFFNFFSFVKKIWKNKIFLKFNFCLTIFQRNFSSKKIQLRSFVENKQQQNTGHIQHIVDKIDKNSGTQKNEEIL